MTDRERSGALGRAPGADLARRWRDVRWHYRRSLASRVALLTTLAVGLSMVFVATGAFLMVSMRISSATDASLLDRAHYLVRTRDPASIADADVPSWMAGAANVRVMYVFNGGVEPLDGRPPMDLGRPELAVAAGALPYSVRTIAQGQEQYRVAAVSAGPGEAVVLAQPLDSPAGVLGFATTLFLLSGAVGIIAAALAGWAVARNGLRPVRRLTATVEEIARTEDFTPLEIEGDDEVARLATAFNAMLTALAASRDRQRRLVADAGHELRTPLTSLRTNLDLLAQADHRGGLPPEARRELLGDVRAQIEELTTLIGDLVELARDDPSTLVVERLDLADVVDRAVARVRRRAPMLAFSVHAESWPVVGDAAALERAVTNLLDNAAKWSPGEGTVTVTLEGGVLTVDDEGPGISPEDAPHVFERFYRSQESRAMPGSGLGLSIVQRVADRHAGSVAAGRAPTGGARLTLRLPQAPEAPSDGVRPARARSSAGEDA